MPEISEKELKELKRLRKVEKEEGFSDKALEFFRYRKNFLIEGDELENKADAIGNFTGACGDSVTIYLKISEGKVEDAKYRTNGCPGAVTGASALTEIAKGKTVEEVNKLKISDIVDFLREEDKSLPKHMYDCCGIAIGSLTKAIKQYKKGGKFNEK